MAVIKNVVALDAAIRAVCPIDGVSGDGTIWYQAGATAPQKAAAAAALAAFVDSTPPGPPPPPMAPPPPPPKPITSN